ncbi:MAG TPA: phosphoribosyltransferase family protein [Sulfuricurvum sp.]|nr:MAG: nicotinate phosphoribosyltransferase [Campylobacterales bacterium 16-40-21]OZA02894.1 MAG: nicotinate phosphoribosyltransferase [Sulfuricurvum sp. 17-40-25]HQS67146.1 phosphoribosyltransferase family protein [Sulfuricurvum sp.]HQT36382.1 phosphoribosyltransferase family protein [Sulfuricurvum sp.]
MIYYSYDRFKMDVQTLTHECSSFEADTILAIARGGMTVGHALSMSLNIRNLQSIRCESYDDVTQRNTVSILGECDFSNSKRVLIVDDIVDSGKTLYALIPILQERYPSIIFSTAAIFTKPTALIQPDVSLHEALEWIDFFWERDFLKSDSL